jgi:hypothetical protein
MPPPHCSGRSAIDGRCLFELIARSLKTEILILTQTFFSIMVFINFEPHVDAHTAHGFYRRQEAALNWELHSAYVFHAGPPKNLACEGNLC